MVFVIRIAEVSDFEEVIDAWNAFWSSQRDSPVIPARPAKPGAGVPWTRFARASLQLALASVRRDQGIDSCDAPLSGSARQTREDNAGCQSQLPPVVRLTAFRTRGSVGSAGRHVATLAHCL